VVSINLPTGVPFVNQDEKAGAVASPKGSDALLRENRVAICPMIKLELLGGTRTEEEFEKLTGKKKNTRCLRF